VSDWALPPGLVGLPPQTAAAPMASNPAALVQQAQNSRRDGLDISSNLVTVVTASGQYSVEYGAETMRQQKP